MPDPWYPNAERNYGRNAGYSSGRSAMRACVCHYTVGRNSTPVGVDGYFHWLVSRDGRIQQFAETDAITWHAGEWNGEGPGIEVEYLDEPTIFTDAARDACGGLVRWLRDEWGIPGVYHDGERLERGSWYGFISHRSLIQSEAHSDWWPAEDFAAMIGAPAPAPERRKDHKVLILNTEIGFLLYWGDIGHAEGISLDTAAWLMDQGIPSCALSWEETVRWSENAQTALARAISQGIADQTGAGALETGERGDGD